MAKNKLFTKILFREFSGGETVSGPVILACRRRDDSPMTDRSGRWLKPLVAIVVSGPLAPRQRHLGTPRAVSISVHPFHLLIVGGPGFISFPFQVLVFIHF
jgi:hypothetical protein